MSSCGPRNDEPAGGEADGVRQAIHALEHLPASVVVVQNALRAIENKFCTNEELQHILSGDPGATADVLRVANSPFFGVSTQIRSLSMAITVVGHARLRTLLRHLMVSKLLESLSVQSSLALRSREKSLAAGVACHEIGRRVSDTDADELLIGGVLHNIGELALMSELPESYEKIAQLTRTMSRRVAEIAVLGVDAQVVSSWLLNAWDFPERLVAAARHWETPQHPSLDRSLQTFVGVVHKGAHLAEAWTRGVASDRLLSWLRNSRFAWIEDDPGLLESVYGRIDPGVEKLSQSLLHVRAA